MTDQRQSFTHSATMTAIGIAEPGGPDVLRAETRPIPVPAVGEILIKVMAAGVNRPDLLQRMGKYPPPKGASDIPGLEVAGIVLAHGPSVPPGTPPIGARVCALLSGGGYATHAVAPVEQVLSLPDQVSFIEGAALPEALFTVWQTVFYRTPLHPGEDILIHGGASGIGTTAIQMVRYMGGGNIFTTVGSDDRKDALRTLGATCVVNYRTEDFESVVLRETGGKGVDMVLDMVGGDYVPRNLHLLKSGGRHITIAMLNGSQATIDLRDILTKGLTLTGSTLRARSPAEKGILRDGLQNQIWPGVISGAIRPLIHATFPLEKAAHAHEALAQGGHLGKIVLVIDGQSA